jgi:hypothetical protein
MTKHRRHRHPDQADLFEVAELFPVLAPTTLPRALDFNRKIAVAMAEAIRQCPRTREEIADEMTQVLGYDEGAVTVAMLNAYTSAARETHTISLVRFVAFVRATGCPWLWDVVLHDEGMIVLQGQEALHAQASLLEKQGRELLEQAEAARRAAPSKVRVPRGRR